MVALLEQPPPQIGADAVKQMLAGLLAVGGAPQIDMAGAQQGDIGLRAGIAPHALIHRRRNRDRRRCRQTQCRQQIIRVAVREEEAYLLLWQEYLEALEF